MIVFLIPDHILLIVPHTTVKVPKVLDLIQVHTNLILPQISPVQYVIVPQIPRQIPLTLPQIALKVFTTKPFIEIQPVDIAEPIC